LKSDYKQYKKKMVLAGLLALAFLLPLISLNAYFLNMMIMSGLWAILVLAWSLIWKTGEFSLGMAGFWAIGAYSAAYVTMRLHLSFWIALPIGGIVSSLVSLLVGPIILRTRTLYFAGITLAFSEMVRLGIQYMPERFGGGYELTGIPAPTFPGVSFMATRVPYYYLVLIVLLITIWVLWRIDRSRVGRLMEAVGINVEPLARSLGIGGLKYKLMAFVLANFFAGLSGAILAHYWLVLYTESFTMHESLLVQIMALVGGAHYLLAGPLIGAFVITVSGILLRNFLTGLDLFFWGILVVLVLFSLPHGLASLGHGASAIKWPWGGKGQEAEKVETFKTAE
jgi:branched-chain amino acid transport system permease protein